MTLPVKPRDPELMALIASHPVKRINAKPVKTAKRDGKITMSRVAAAPVREKLTLGFSFRSLTDRDLRR